ncbi:MAG TPA: hypothetical protein P5188_11860 [Flavobacterium sp.]|nr:hypothetical protein [Flavobacterium sp.]
MNRAVFLNTNESDYYLDDKFVFTAKRRTGLKYYILPTLCNVNNSEKNILTFSYANYFFFFRIKIIHQDLETKISINKQNFFRYALDYGDERIVIKHNLNPFSKKVCKIYSNENFVGTITRQLKSSKTNYLFEFLPSFKSHRAAMLCFIINNLGIEDIAV